MTDQITPSPGDVPRAAEPPEITPVQYALEVVAELHSSEPGVSNGVPANVCRECLKVWPCPTARALEPLTETTKENR